VPAPRDAAVLVRVPASTANLGPGYDAIGLALGLHDEVEVAVTPPGSPTLVDVIGEGAEVVPHGEEHLVVRTMRTVLSRAGVHEQPGLHLRCRNTVPHGRGLGSSATAIVTGVMAASALLRPDGVDVAEVVHIASALEGHPDNAAASVLGGMTVGWHAGDGRWHAVRLEPHPDVEVVVCVPDAELPTARARAMLPDRVPHGDAAFTAGRASLLVEAMTRSPHLLLPDRGPAPPGPP
jgi:homoserine kinase